MIMNYLTVLQESLEKKNAILDEIQAVNRAQNELFQAEKLDLQKFDSYVEQKDTYIKELEALDEGFETLYNNVKQQLQQNKSQYAEQIKRMQQLIGEITEKSVSIQAQESTSKMRDRLWAREDVRPKWQWGITRT